MTIQCNQRWLAFHLRGPWETVAILQHRQIQMLSDAGGLLHRESHGEMWFVEQACGCHAAGSRSIVDFIRLSPMHEPSPRSRKTTPKESPKTPSIVSAEKSFSLNMQASSPAIRQTTATAISLQAVITHLR